MPRRRVLPYDPALKPLARSLRKDGTLAEVLLWRRLKGKQVRGYSFYRQRPIDRYIVDFFCPELMLAVEVDGSSHDQKGAADRERQERLESLGVHVVRFEDRDVRLHIDDVLFAIDRWIEEASSETDCPQHPPSKGDRGA